MSVRQLWWRFVWYPLVASRYVSLDRFHQEQRAYVSAEHRYHMLREWVETKRHHETDRPNWNRIASESWEYAVRCHPFASASPGRDPRRPLTTAPDCERQRRRHSAT